MTPRPTGWTAPSLDEGRKAAFAEFKTWEEEHEARHLDPLPPPWEAGGLPAGWQPVHTFKYTNTLLGVVVRREAGGWLLVLHVPGQMTIDSTFGATLGGLLSEVAAPAGGSDAKQCFTDGIRDLYHYLFDLSDPMDAAEATVFALGGPVVNEPWLAL